MPRADQGVGGIARIFALPPKVERCAQLGFQQFGGLGRDKVDSPAHAVRPVEHRDITLGDLHFGDVIGKEAAKIEPVVSRKIDTNAIHRQRHLKAGETAHEDQALIAAAPAVAGRNAGSKRNCIIQRYAGKSVNGFRVKRLAGDLYALGGLADHNDLPQSKTGGLLLCESRHGHS